MSNNIIVPVHSLSHFAPDHEHEHGQLHVHADEANHESEAVDCKALHATPHMALYSYDCAINLSPIHYSAPHTRTIVFSPFITSTAIYIRAPPILAS